VQNSGGSNAFRVRNDGTILFGNDSNNVWMFPYTTYDTLDVNGRNLAIYPLQGSISIGGGSQIQTSGTQNNLITKGRFQPSSGTATFTEIRSESFINQTGGANGITRGLYVNPTLTAAADWRSIEWSNNSGWGLYGAGTAPNFLGGNLGIGTTGVTIVNLRISRNFEGSTTAYGVLLDGSIRSGVTSQALGFTSNVSLQNTAFTLSQLRHFYAIPSASFGSATVTNQTGFYVENTLTGATNNYGFVSDIPNGTNRWNLYMAGTADNYLAGKLLINTTTVGTFNLDVNGTARVSGNTYLATSSGSVGIGTSSPGYKLDVNGSAALRASGSFNLYVADNTNWSYIQNTGASSGTNNLGFFVSGATADLFISPAGRVGIGTTSPTGTRLDVREDTANAIRWGSTTTQYGFASWDINLAIIGSIGASTSIGFWTNGNTERMRITSGGNLLVGTTADAGEKFQVNGTARVSGAMLISSGTTSQGVFIGPGGSIRYTSESGVNTNAVYCSGNTTTQDVIISYVGGNATSNINSYIQTSGYIGTKGGLRLGAASGTDVLTALTNTWLNVAAGTTARSQINLASSTAPTSPNNGDIWFDGTDLKIRVGGLTRTIVLL
jgi:hypothetical protein